MAMAVAAGISSVAVPVYAAPAENTVATDNTNKKEAEAVTDATAEAKENTEVKDSAEAPAEDTVRSRWMASRPTDETVEKWVTAYNKDNHCFDADYKTQSQIIDDLKRENNKLKKDNDILKKTITLLAKKD